MAYDLDEPLTVEQFEDALWKGLGRTVLCVQRYGDELYRDSIIHACVCDLRFDRQTMDDHCDQLFDIIAASSSAHWYVNHLTEVLPTLDPEQTDPWQTIGVLRRFAERGNGTARTAVIDAFDRNAGQGGIDYLEDILLLEGATGFMHAAELVPIDSIPIDDQWRVWSAVSYWEDRDGETSVRQLIRSLPGTSPQADRWIEYLESKWREIEERRYNVTRSRTPETYDEFTGRLNWCVRRGRESVVRTVLIAMRTLSDETVERLALDLLNETDPLRRLALLRAFRHRPFPKSHHWLMPYLKADDEDVREAALRAIAQITHDDVRELALTGAASEMRADLVAELMVRNARAGDESLLFELSRRDLEPNIYHRLTLDLRRTLERHPEIEPGNICLELYERGPCSFCRQGIVELLMKAGRLPEWMKAELPFDSERGTRELIAEGKPSCS